MALVIIISAESVDLLASDPAFCKDARMTSKMLKLFKPGPFLSSPIFRWFCRKLKKWEKGFCNRRR